MAKQPVLFTFDETQGYSREQIERVEDIQYRPILPEGALAIGDKIYRPSICVPVFNVKITKGNRIAWESAGFYPALTGENDKLPLMLEYYRDQIGRWLMMDDNSRIILSVVDFEALAEEFDYIGF